MIGISAKIFDLSGALIFLSGVADASYLDISRRVSNTPTLDGGGFVSDAGYSDSDRIFKYQISDLSEAEVLNITRIVKLHSRLWLTNSEGAFEVLVDNANYSSGVYSINLITAGAA